MLNIVCLLVLQHVEFWWNDLIPVLPSIWKKTPHKHNYWDAEKICIFMNKGLMLKIKSSLYWPQAAFCDWKSQTRSCWNEDLSKWSAASVTFLIPKASSRTDCYPFKLVFIMDKWGLDAVKSPLKWIPPLAASTQACSCNLWCLKGFWDTVKTHLCTWFGLDPNLDTRKSWYQKRSIQTKSWVTHVATTCTAWNWSLDGQGHAPALD